MLVRQSEVPFEQRAAAFRPVGLPVPADVLVYTAAEWAALAERSPRFFRTLAAETLWLIGAPPGKSPWEGRCETAAAVVRLVLAGGRALPWSCVIGCAIMSHRHQPRGRGA